MYKINVPIPVRSSLKLPSLRKAQDSNHYASWPLKDHIY